MKQILFVFFLLIPLLTGCEQNPDISKAEEIKKILDLSSKWTNSIISKDLQTILHIYSDDAVQLLTYGPMLKGKEQIKEWYSQWLYDSTLSYSASTEYIDISSSADLAYERGKYKINNEAGRFITVWKKINGSWKVVSDNSIPGDSSSLKF